MTLARRRLNVNEFIKSRGGIVLNQEEEDIISYSDDLDDDRSEIYAIWEKIRFDAYDWY